MLFEKITRARNARSAERVSTSAAGAPSKRRDLADAFRLAKPYFLSEERRAAWTLLAAVIGLNLANVYVHVRINQWSAAEYNALGMYDFTSSGASSSSSWCCRPSTSSSRSTRFI